jgi:UDP-N-acetylglucosamine--N-acetylmuramyl-(pentapeptide) pyrophosphoryl-undecaprenol N-acetylglucosamine transferase
MTAPRERAPGSGPLSVVLAGGGTAGHVEPALALADALRRRDPSTVVTALGTATGLEARLVPARGYALAEIPLVPLPRRLTPDLLRVPARVAGAVRRTRAHLDRVSADVVVGFGGYVALPAYLAARRRGTPLVVHEANARAGLANRVGARLTPHVAAAVEGCGLPEARVLGIPLRAAVARLDRAASRDEARAAFGLDPGPVLLVTGGSQGARAVNAAVTGAAADLAAAGVQVLHVAGPKQADAVRSALQEALPQGVPASHHVLPYVDRMELAYAAADLAVCRAGALTCAELAAVGLPAVYVPLPVGNGEQALNARPVVAAGGGLLVEDASFDAAAVRGTVLPLLRDAERLAAMSSAAAAFGHRDADEALADLVLTAAGPRGSA